MTKRKRRNQRKTQRPRGLEADSPRDIETARSHAILERSKEKFGHSAGKTALPRVKFTGQQPGEEGVERDDSPGPDDDKDNNRRVEDREKIVPIGDPPSKRKPSTDR